MPEIQILSFKTALEKPHTYGVHSLHKAHIMGNKNLFLFRIMVTEIQTDTEVNCNLISTDDVTWRLESRR